MSYPKANNSDRTPHTEVAITQPGVMDYTAYVRKSCHCASDIMIVADDREVMIKKIAIVFSKPQLVM